MNKAENSMWRRGRQRPNEWGRAWEAIASGCGKPRKVPVKGKLLLFPMSYMRTYNSALQLPQNFRLH